MGFCYGKSIKSVNKNYRNSSGRDFGGIFRNHAYLYKDRVCCGGEYEHGTISSLSDRCDLYVLTSKDTAFAYADKEGYDYLFLNKDYIKKLKNKYNINDY